MPRDAASPPKFQPLPRAFFEPGAETVAPLLLGHFLVHRTEEGVCGGIIVEAEAYLANDPACHAFKGQTKRNAMMFAGPGTSYVYLIYGFHFCFNAVCRPAGVGEAVLIRAIEPVWEIQRMRERRGDVAERHLTSGPGKLCAALGITRAQDGADLCSRASQLIIAKNPNKTETIQELGPVTETTRIGITQAAEWPLRWYLDGSRFVSRR
jgi:DNA-3-methyladenine glycosylase